MAIAVALFPLRARVCVSPSLFFLVVVVVVFLGVADSDSVRF